MDKDISICMVVHAYYPFDTRIRREAECLIEDGYTVEIFCLRDDGEVAVESVNGVIIRRLPVKRHQGSSLMIYFVEYLAFFIMSTFAISFHGMKKRYKLVVVHNQPDFLVFAATIPKILGAKIILDIHDVVPELFASKYNLDKDSRIIKFISWIESISTKFADHVITAGDPFKEAIVSRGCPRDKIDVVMNVADEKLFNINAYEKNEHCTGRSLKLIYHGALNEQYDFNTLIMAVAILRDRIKNVELDIFGNGPLLGSVKERISELSLTDRVHLWGWVASDRIPHLILSHDFGIVPMSESRFASIAFPTKLFEYVAMQRPVIASRRESIEKYFDDSSIMFFEPSNSEDLANCIEELYLKPEKARSLVSNATKAYQPYRWAVTRLRYCELIAKLCMRI